MSTDYIPDENYIVVPINELKIGTWYTIYAARYFGHVKQWVWAVVAEGVYSDLNMGGSAYYFVRDIKDYSGYVYDQKVDHVRKQDAITGNYKFVTRKKLVSDLE